MILESFLQSRLQKIISVVAACGLYGGLYLVLEPQIGLSSMALSALPIAWAGSLLGT